jgi:hypothetical protein
MYSIELEDGSRVHATMEYEYDEECFLKEYSDGEPIGYLVPILTENGDTIPLSVCLCNARYSGECCCACTSWDEEVEDN